MKQIALDASGWRQPDDFYRALLPQLGAPAWHGHNLDAIDDSIFGGGINRVEAPFHVAVANTAGLDEEMRAFLGKVISIFRERRKEADATISFDPPLTGL